MAKVVAMMPGGRRKTFKLDRPQFTVGRSEDCDIPLPGETRASRHHLQINVIAGVISVEDLNSANGTWHEGSQVARRTIEDRDVLVIGETRLQFLFDDNAKPDPPKARKQRALGTVDKEFVNEILPNGNWQPVDHPVPYIELLDGEHQGLKLALTRPMILGRGGSADVILEGKKVSNSHARFEPLGNDGHECYVSDLGSTNGTLVNMARLEERQPQRLFHDDIVEVGEFRVGFRMPAELRTHDDDALASASGSGERAMIARYTLRVIAGGSRAGERIHLAERVKIGRHAYNTIPIDGEKVSNYHAEVRATGDRFEVTDLRSTNGTFVNGRRVSPKRPKSLEHGDLLSIASHIFVFEEAGRELDVDAEIFRVRNEARMRRVVTFLTALVVLGFAGASVALLGDMIAGALAPAAGDTGSDSGGLPLRASLPRLGFEVDGPTGSSVPGWVVETLGTTTRIEFDNETVSGGEWSLKLVPAAEETPGAGIRMRARPDLAGELARQLGGQEGNTVRVKVATRIAGLTGVVGVRLIWFGESFGANGSPVTIAWLPAANVQEGGWLTLEGTAPWPAAPVAACSVELFVQGDCEEIWWDEVEVTRESGDVAPWSPTLPDSERLAVRFSGPAHMRWMVGTPLRQVVDRAELVLLTRTGAPTGSDPASADDDSAAGTGEPVWVLARRAGQAGPISVIRRSPRELQFDYTLFGPVSRLEQTATLMLRAGDSIWNLEPDLLATRLSDREALALALEMTPGPGAAPYRLQLFNSHGDAVTPPRGFSGLIGDVAELCWGSPGNRREIGLHFAPRADVIVRSTSDRTVCYVVLGIGDRGEAPTIGLRGFPSLRKDAAAGLLNRAVAFASQPGTQGDALLLLQEGLRRYEGFSDNNLDYGEEFRRRIREIDAVREDLFDSARGNTTLAFDASLEDADSAAAALGYTMAGLEACDAYRARFRAIVDELRQIDAWRLLLRQRRTEVLEKLQGASAGVRRREAVRLIERAKLRAGIPQAWPGHERPALEFKGPSKSSLRARTFAAIVATAYADISGQASQARLIMDAIDALWASENTGPSGPALTAIEQGRREEAKLAPDHEAEPDWVRALDGIRVVLATYPRSPHRIDLLARLYWYTGEQAVSAGDSAPDGEAGAAFRRAIDILPRPGADESGNNARQQLRVTIERRAATLGFPLD